jgi:hypothetical protein
MTLANRRLTVIGTVSGCGLKANIPDGAASNGVCAKKAPAERCILKAGAVMPSRREGKQSAAREDPEHGGLGIIWVGAEPLEKLLATARRRSLIQIISTSELDKKGRMCSGVGEGTASRKCPVRSAVR